MLKTIKAQLLFLKEEELLSEINEIGIWKSYEKKETILKINQYYDRFPIIVEGSIKVLREDDKDHEIFMYFLNSNPKELISLFFSLKNKKSEVKAIADQNTTCLWIPIEKFSEWTCDYPSWKKFIFKAYNHYLQEIMGIIDKIAFTKIDKRLEDHLKQMARHEKTVNLAITHQEIANDLNTSRETISRLLKRFEEEGIIQLGRNKIIILEKKIAL